jgi:hypothetical protein
MECALYPCFDITSGKTVREEKVRWVCGRCEKRGAQAKERTVSGFARKRIGGGSQYA